MRRLTEKLNFAFILRECPVEYVLCRPGTFRQSRPFSTGANKPATAPGAASRIGELAMFYFMIAAVAAVGGFVAGALTGAVGLLLLASAWASSATRQLNDKPARQLDDKPNGGHMDAPQGKAPKRFGVGGAR
jgi:hypothetical protein